MEKKDWAPSTPQTQSELSARPTLSSSEARSTICSESRIMLVESDMVALQAANGEGRYIA